MTLSFFLICLLIATPFLPGGHFDRYHQPDDDLVPREAPALAKPSGYPDRRKREAVEDSDDGYMDKQMAQLDKLRNTLVMNVRAARARFEKDFAALQKTFHELRGNVSLNSNDEVYPPESKEDWTPAEDRIFMDDFSKDGFQDPVDGLKNAKRGFAQGTATAFVDSWRYLAKGRESRSKRSAEPFIPFFPNPYNAMRNLLDFNDDSWRPNIPFVILDNRNPRPVGFNSAGAVPSYSRPDPGAIYYNPRGLGRHSIDDSRIGSTASIDESRIPASHGVNEDNLRPSDFGINESLLGYPGNVPNGPLASTLFHKRK